MYINITDSATANNKGSSGVLVNYLEKENRLYNKEEPEYWFNNERQQIEPYEVRRKLESNIAKLSKTDAKFFLINISPSQKEIRHIIDSYGEQGAKEKLKVYAEKVMDNYARNFKRPGIRSSSDLVWFAKLENHRYYSHKDKEVKEGSKKRGDMKEGQQTHVQVIVSRKDATNTIKLSPMNKSRGKNAEHSQKLGQFNQVAFKESGEATFDELFQYQRNIRETTAYANIQKKGNISQREQLAALEKGAERNPAAGTQLNMTAEISNGLFMTANDLLKSTGETSGDILKALLETSFEPSGGGHSMEEEAAIRKRRRKSQGQGLKR